MTSALRLAISLALSLVLWAFTLPSALQLDEGPETIALRYLVALVVSRIGVGLVFRLVRGYAAPLLEQAEDDGAEAEEVGESLPFGRRKTDLAPAEDALTDEQRLDDALGEAQQAATLVDEPAA